MKTLEELQTLRDKARADMQTKDGHPVTRVVVGMATCGLAAGAAPIYDVLEKAVEAAALPGVVVTPTGCVGICQYEPVVEVFEPNGTRTTYVNMAPDKIVRIVDEHLKGGRPVAEFTIGDK